MPGSEVADTRTRVDIDAVRNFVDAEVATAAERAAAGSLLRSRVCLGRELERLARAPAPLRPQPLRACFLSSRRCAISFTSVAL